MKLKKIERWNINERIILTQNSKTSQHRCASPTANAFSIHSFQATEEIFLVNTSLSGLIQLIGENVQPVAVSIVSKALKVGACP